MTTSEGSKIDLLGIVEMINDFNRNGLKVIDAGFEQESDQTQSLIIDFKVSGEAETIYYTLRIPENASVNERPCTLLMCSQKHHRVFHSRILMNAIMNLPDNPPLLWTMNNKKANESFVEWVKNHLNEQKPFYDDCRKLFEA